MIGALVVALLLQTAPADPAEAAPAPAKIELSLERAHPRVGDRVVVTAALPLAAGERVRFARPPEVDAAFARIEPLLSEATGRAPATLRLEMVAAAAGTFRVGPFSILAAAADANGAAGGRELETGTLDVEVAPSWGEGRASGFDEWRGPVAPPTVAAPRRWPWIVGLAAALALAAGWIARRRRDARDSAPVVLPPAVARTWRDELDRLAANIPEGIVARRIWWSDLSHVLRGELSHRSRDDSPDRTTEELAATSRGAAAGALRDELVALLRRTDDGKFARPSAGIALASSAVTEALRLLEKTARAPADPS